MNDGARAAGVHLTQGLHKAGSTQHPWLLISSHSQCGRGWKGVLEERLLMCLIPWLAYNVMI